MVAHLKLQRLEAQRYVFTSTAREFAVTIDPVMGIPLGSAENAAAFREIKEAMRNPYNAERVTNPLAKEWFTVTRGEEVLPDRYSPIAIQLGDVQDQWCLQVDWASEADYRHWLRDEDWGR